MLMVSVPCQTGEDDIPLLTTYWFLSSASHPLNCQNCSSSLDSEFWLMEVLAIASFNIKRDDISVLNY